MADIFVLPTATAQPVMNPPRTGRQGRPPRNVKSLSNFRNEKRWRAKAEALEANIANGPQQVNNGTTPTAPAPTHAEETASAPSRLLEANASPAFEYVKKGADEHERLDQGTARRPDCAPAAPADYILRG